jgi:hypothetical protein
MNTKAVVLSVIAVVLIFAVTKSFVLAVALFALEMLLWVVVRAVKTQRWHTNNGTPPSLS